MEVRRSDLPWHSPGIWGGGVLAPANTPPFIEANPQISLRSTPPLHPISLPPQRWKDCREASVRIKSRNARQQCIPATHFFFGRRCLVADDVRCLRGGASRHQPAAIGP